MPARAIVFAILIAALMLFAGQGAAAAERHYNDKQLYREIAAEVAAGRSYYQAAADLQRAHHYPLKPGITVRLPTLSLVAAWIGWEGLRVLAFALLGVVAATWFRALRGKAALPERLAAAALILAGGGMLTGNPVILHERWAGLLLCLALALRIGWRDAWPWTLAAVGLALAIRELALPFALLALAFAAWERRWREAAAWSAAIALFAGLVAVHVRLVAEQVRAQDLASQGWNAFGGPRMVAAAVIDTSFLQYLVMPVATAIAGLALVGWVGLRRRERPFCLMLLGGYALMIALFARPDNFYWGAILQPTWLVGLAFLPHGVARAWRANLAGRRARL